VDPSSVVKPKPAWSSVPAEVQSVPLKEIMKEEISQLQQKKEVHGSVQQEKVRGSSWAAKIGSKVEASPPVASPLQPVLSNPSSAAPSSVVGKAAGAPSDRQPVAVNSNKIVKSTDKSDFGGKRMSKELSDWCASQLKAIKGIEDITLMEFCMSLNSAVEIRETMASYLGSSPQVNDFRC
jgi:hypothetical protein